MPLGDGKVLWVVCDPNALAGGLTNSVAVADPDDRTPPFQRANFVRPDPADVGRCSDHGGAASWINGVTAAPGRRPGTTLVTAFFIHGCRSSLLDREDVGDYGVATYTYVHGSPGPRRARVHRWDLFPGAWSSGERNVPFGAGAVYAEGYQYAYGCHPDEEPDWVNEQQCSVARASLDDPVGDRSSWAVWRGPEDGWRACTPERPSAEDCSEEAFRDAVGAAAPMEMPLPDGEGTDGFIPQQFSVSWSEHLDRFVSSAPRAFADPTLRIRVASHPEGPWSEPGDVGIECDPGAVEDGFNCYHLAPHPALGDDASLPFTFHDAGHEGPADLAVVSVPWCELRSLDGRPCP